MGKEKEDICPYCGEWYISLSRHKKCRIKKICEELKTLSLSGFVPDRRRKKVTNIKDISLQKQFFTDYVPSHVIPHLKSSNINISLDKLINLEKLVISYRPTLTEVDGLENLKNLKQLLLPQNGIKEIKGLKELTKLQELSFWHNQITEIKGLETLTNLESLMLFDNQITEIKGLDTLIKLKTLRLRNNQIAEIRGLDALTNLEWLNLGHNQIAEIKGLGTLTNLQTLHLDYNQITEIENLEALTNVQTLYLGYNQISEIEGLESLINLQKLDLSNNFYITELKGFETLDNLQELKLDGTNILPSLLEKLGGLDESGKLTDPQKVVEYCKLKKQESIGEKSGIKPKLQEQIESSEVEKKSVKIKEIDTIALKTFLLRKLEALDGTSPSGSFEAKGPPTGKILTEIIGPWLWFKVRLEYIGATWDQSTDRASGDPYEAHIFRDWIGYANSAPKKVFHPEELDKWSLLRTYFLREYTDVGVWGRHSGSYVDDLQEDGTVRVRIAGENFHDESPDSKTSVQYVYLKKIKKEN